MSFDYDVAVIGSGFGGSVAALRLTEKGYQVGVFEAGRRFEARDFPSTNWNVRRYLWFPRVGMRGPQRLSLLRDMLVLSGVGVGGGSLVYANTLYEPLEDFWHDRQWSAITDWKAELAPYYPLAKAMLGAVEFPFETPADRVLHEVASRMGVGETYHPTTVGVYFGDGASAGADPYFGGLGPSRFACTRCGRCMVGCRDGGKNSLDRNYLWLAGRAGAVIHPESLVSDLRPLPGGGYELAVERPGAWFRHHRRSFTAEQVVFAGGVLGTVGMLLALKARGRLPGLSDRLGKVVRSNCETIRGATTRRLGTDYSKGVSITSSFYPSRDTHIEAVRYPKGSNLIGLLATILVPSGQLPRVLRFLAQAVRDPITFLRASSVHHWSERTLVLLVMQSRDTSLGLTLKKRPWGPRLTTSRQGARLPSDIPAGNVAARYAADDMDGFPGSTLNEVIGDIPLTAHILGGACVGTSPATGVIDPYHRVFGHAGLHVVDGSAISANLGVNPALTITALAERAFAYWPNKGEADPRPPPLEYRPVPPVPARDPAVRAITSRR